MMMDNDFPLITSPPGLRSTQYPRDQFGRPSGFRTPPINGTDPSFSIQKLPHTLDSGLNFLQNFISGSQNYSQAGTDIPSFGLNRDYEGGYGTDFDPYYRESISATPSFDLGYPKIPGRNLEGVPNANDPIMREKLRQRLLRNPKGGEDLPGFVKQA